ncbi:MAG: hypothetical protein E7379_03185 [Clostridiales bacterium]|nr:hypothetical protein [Clostridiales bacterium]
MKFYYPEFDINKGIKTLDGKHFSTYAVDIKPSTMYLRIDHGDYVRFIDHFGNRASKDYSYATVYDDSGFANISKPGDKPRYLDIFLRESDSPTYSGAAAYGLFSLLYAKDCLRVTHEYLISALEDFDYSYFADEVFYEGMIKMMVKYLRDEVQYAYENNLQQDCEQTIREVLQKIKNICFEKRKVALQDLEKKNSAALRRKNAYEHGIKFLDNYKFGDASEDERKMICVNEEDDEEYGK